LTGSKRRILSEATAKNKCEKKTEDNNALKEKKQLILQFISEEEVSGENPIHHYKFRVIGGLKEHIGAELNFKRDFFSEKLGTPADEIKFEVEEICRLTFEGDLTTDTEADFDFQFVNSVGEGAEWGKIKLSRVQTILIKVIAGTMDRLNKITVFPNGAWALENNSD
jgi:hypothetical protein